MLKFEKKEALVTPPARIPSWDWTRPLTREFRTRYYEDLNPPGH